MSKIRGHIRESADGLKGRRSKVAREADAKQSAAKTKVKEEKNGRSRSRGE